jgi:hypothetical protein
MIVVNDGVVSLDIAAEIVGATVIMFIYLFYTLSSLLLPIHGSRFSTSQFFFYPCFSLYL